MTVPIELLTRETLYQAAQCLLGTAKPNQVLQDSQVLYDFCLSNGIKINECWVVDSKDTVQGTPLHMWLLWEAMSSLKNIPIISQEDANLRRSLSWWLYDNPEHRQAPAVEKFSQGYPPHTWYAWLTYQGTDAMWTCIQIGDQTGLNEQAKIRAQLLVNLEKHLPARVQNL